MIVVCDVSWRRGRRLMNAVVVINDLIVRKIMHLKCRSLSGHDPRQSIDKPLYYLWWAAWNIAGQCKVEKLDPWNLNTLTYYCSTDTNWHEHIVYRISARKYDTGNYWSSEHYERAVVVAQLVEWLLSIPEVWGSNPVIGNILFWTFTVKCIEKTKIKKKRHGNGPFLKKQYEISLL